MRPVLRAVALVLMIAVGGLQGAHAQVQVPQKVIEDAAREGCDDSVVLRDCRLREASPNTETKTPDDAITRSRDRAKSGLARNARESSAAATGSGGGEASSSDAGGAQQLAPVTVTGSTAKGPPPSPEAVIQKALNPEVVILSNGNTLRYAPDGTRIECQASCTGPACCKVLRDRPDPAALSNSIGR